MLFFVRLTLVSVEDFVPVFPHGLVAEGADFAGDGFRRALVADVELLERVGLCGIASRVGLASGTHRCDTELHQVCAELRVLARRV